MEGSSAVKWLGCGCLFSPVLVVLLLILFVLSVVSVDTDENDDWTVDGSGGVGLASGAVPPDLVPWIEKAANSCDHPGLTAPVLAAQLWQESKFDENALGPPVTLGNPPGTWRAEGIAQFMPYTWEEWAVDADDNGQASAFDAPDAITAQGNFMCDLVERAENSGYEGDAIVLALAGYNAGWGAVQNAGGVPNFPETLHYVEIIMEKSLEFTDSEGDLINVEGDIAGAIQWAVAQVDTWYVYGGACMNPQKSMEGSPHNWTPNDFRNNCDCSSLMQQAYAKIDVSLPRTTFDQINVGTGVSPSNVQPGDLVFPHAGHVGMYIGDGKVVHAPYTGVRVEITNYTESYWGAYGVRRVMSSDDS